MSLFAERSEQAEFDHDNNLRPHIEDDEYGMNDLDLKEEEEPDSDNERQWNINRGNGRMSESDHNTDGEMIKY